MSTNTQQRRVVTREIGGWPVGTEVEVREENGEVILVSDCPDGGWQVTQGHLDRPNSALTDDVGRYAWYTSQGRVESHTRPADEAHPTFTLRENEGWPAGTNITLIPEARYPYSTRPLRLLVSPTDGGWTIAHGHVAEYGIPEQYVGWRGYWTDESNLPRLGYGQPPEVTEEIPVGARVVLAIRYETDDPGRNSTVWDADALVGHTGVLTEESDVSTPARRMVEVTWDHSGRATRIWAGCLKPEPQTYPVTGRSPYLPEEWVGGRIGFAPMQGLDHSYEDWQRAVLVESTESSTFGSSTITQEHIERDGLPLAWLGKDCWNVPPNFVEQVKAQPEVAQPEQAQPEQEMAPLYVVPASLATIPEHGGDTDGVPATWVGNRVAIFDGPYRPCVFSEDGTRAGGGMPLTDEEAAMLPAGWPRGVRGWSVDPSVADQLRQHPWTPEPEEPSIDGGRWFTVPDRAVWPSEWRGQRAVWFEGRGLCLSRQSGGWSATPGRGDVPSVLPEGQWYGYYMSSGSIPDPELTIQPTVQPTAQPTTETVEELRRTLACLREEQEERMREIGSAAIRWGREHGYESSVLDFLPTIGLDPDVLDEDEEEETPVYEWEVVITVRGSGQRTDGTESGQNFFEQSLRLDEDYDDDGRAILFGIDDDWENVSLDTTYQITSFTQA